ncbi:MAG: ribosomal protein S18-alanine N-acetyltransferase [Eubacterium sp.]|nr:ribosomal protein S18-alanine N-acetyltransferase [Eubacterium sp.]
MNIMREIARLEAENFTDAWSEESLGSTFEYDYNHLLIEEKDGRVVGYIIYADIQGDAELLRIAVDKRYRRTGIGNKLMKDMISELVEAGTDRISLEVRAHNLPAIALYKKYGFEEIFVRENYYHNPDDDALILIKGMDK